MEYGWRDQMKAYCKGKITQSIHSIKSLPFRIEIVKQKGLENITVDELVQEITPKGRGKNKWIAWSNVCWMIVYLALVPDTIKKEMLARLRQYLSKHEEL